MLLTAFLALVFWSCISYLLNRSKPKRHIARPTTGPVVRKQIARVMEGQEN
jgi:hypothetical protein